MNKNLKQERESNEEISGRRVSYSEAKDRAKALLQGDSREFQEKSRSLERREDSEKESERERRKKTHREPDHQVPDVSLQGP